ncbi:MAG: CehA/McbA family metallohydrolase [Myxococcales bacterium]|nr:CehA/McbA family metallohydrolase [Myxococcota bacterium]MDW8281074.1 CehA/McbA family metallohydrolase [Myxococcales bacterium]
MRLSATAGLALLVCCTSASEAPPPGETELPPPGGPALQVTVRSGDDLQPLPSRLLIRAVPPTRQPSFRSDGATTVEIAPQVVGDPEGALLVTGQATLPLPPGTYEVRATAGPEYEIALQRVTVPQSQVATLDVTLEHSVRTDGWIAADMHVHSALSGDSRLHARHRVISEVTSGIELIVPTEHVWHNDFSAELYALGYGSRAVTIPGSEYGFRDGHIGVYPVRFDPQGPLFGAPEWERWPWHGIDPETYFPLIHALPGEPVIVMAHPRLPPDLGYLRNIRWQPGMPLPTASLFDGMEVLPGYEQTPAQVTALVADWFYLLNQGHRITALGNSDTHRLDWLRAGYPRSWLRLPTEDPQRVLPEDLRAAVRGMRAVASNGPFVLLRAGDREIGDTVSVRGGRLRVEVLADAPSWIDLDQLLMYRNGTLVRELPIQRRGHPALREVVDLDVPQDGWLVAMVVGRQPLPVEIIGQLGGGTVRPIAFTNPLWLDADGDGQVRPPLGPPPRPMPLGVPAEPPPGGLEELLQPLHAPLDCEPSAWPGL